MEGDKFLAIPTEVREVMGILCAVSYPQPQVTTYFASFHYERW
jgi:hypothetical protein